MHANYEGTSVSIDVPVVVGGEHVDPDYTTVFGDGMTAVLSSHPSATPTIARERQGYYTISFAGLSPALAVGDDPTVAIDGAVAGEAWSTWTERVRIERKPATVAENQAGLSTFDPASDEVTTNAASRTASKADLTALESRLTAARAGYLDNLNVGGAVAAQSDVLAINQSASRRWLLQVFAELERPESGTTDYIIYLTTYGPDGGLEEPTTPPTFVAMNSAGITRSNLGTQTKEADGLYTILYTVDAADTLEGLVISFQAVMADGTFTGQVMTSVVDEVGATKFLASDRSAILNTEAAAAAVVAKLPTTATLTGTANADGSGYSTHNAADVKTAMEASGGDLNKLIGMTEVDGTGRSFTTKALEQCPGMTTADRTSLQNAESAATAVAAKLPTASKLTGTETVDGSGYSTHDADAVKDSVEAADGKLDQIWTATEDDGGNRRLKATAFAALPDVTVSDITAAALARFATVDTDEDGAIAGSVCSLSRADLASAMQTVTLAEAYPAPDATEFTLAQAFFVLFARLCNQKLVDDTIQLRNVAGSTVMTLKLDRPYAEGPTDAKPQVAS